MTPAIIIIADASTRSVTAGCPHGEIEVLEALPSTWSENEQVAYALALHQLRTQCDCLGVPESEPEHVPATVVVKIAEGPFAVPGFSEDEDDPAIEHARPKIIPGWAVSRAGWRIKRGHASPTEKRLVDWFKLERDSTDEAR